MNDIPTVWDSAVKQPKTNLKRLLETGLLIYDNGEGLRIAIAYDPVTERYGVLTSGFKFRSAFWSTPYIEGIKRLPFTLSDFRHLSFEKQRALDALYKEELSRNEAMAEYVRTTMSELGLDDDA